jgi:hypothetical protein
MHGPTCIAWANLTLFSLKCTALYDWSYETGAQVPTCAEHIFVDAYVPKRFGVPSV